MHSLIREFRQDFESKKTRYKKKENTKENDIYTITLTFLKTIFLHMNTERYPVCSYP